MISKVAFTMYPVVNLDRAKKFYEDNLNLIPSKISAEGKWLEYDLPNGGCFAITTMAEGVLPSNKAGGSIAFEVENLESVVSNLKKKKVEVAMDTFQSPVCRFAVILDSEGNGIILHELNK